MLTASGIAQNHGNLIFYITSQSNPGEQRAAKKLQFLKKVAKMQCKPFLAEFFSFFLHVSLQNNSAAYLKRERVD